MTFKAIALKVAAVSGDVPLIFSSQADLQLPVPHAQYHAWLARQMLPSQYNKALTAICMVKTRRDCCLDHKMYACLRLTREPLAYICGPEFMHMMKTSAWHANELVLLLLLACAVLTCINPVLQAQGKLWEMTSAGSEEVERIHAGMRELVCRRYKHVDLERIANGEVGEVEEVHPQEDPTYRQHLNSLRYHSHPPSQQQK